MRHLVPTSEGQINTEGLVFIVLCIVVFIFERARRTSDVGFVCLMRLCAI